MGIKTFLVKKTIETAAKRLPFDKAHSSPLGMAVHTANHVMQNMKVVEKATQGLFERSAVGLFGNRVGDRVARAAGRRAFQMLEKVFL
jgi:hypothetical protein